MASKAHLARRGIINGQSIQPFSKEKLGLSDYSRAGCCYIGVYNVMQLANRPISLGAVAGQFVGGPCGSLLHGLWGGAPWHAGRFLKKYLGRSRYRGFLRLSRLEAEAQPGDIILFFMMNHPYRIDRAFHCMAGRYDKDGLELYNVKNRSPLPCRFASLKDKATEGRFIYGYLIREHF